MARRSAYVPDFQRPQSTAVSALLALRQGNEGGPGDIGQRQFNAPQAGPLAFNYTPGTYSPGSFKGAAQGSASYAGLSPAESWIVQRESGNRTTADNPTSTAYGLGQLLIGNRQKYGAQFGYSPNTTDYAQQLAMFRAYVRDRYRTPEAAQAFWQAHGWY
jgi:hypothetical protein